MHNKKLLSNLTVLGYLVMIIVNILANVIPINQVRTGEISDKYANLFAPAGYVFSIWIIIYILLGMYSYYQFTLFGRRSDMSDRVVYRVNQYFLASSLFNGAWIFAWHYEKIGISLILMILIFGLLLRARITITHRSTLTHDEKLSVQLPFSVYLAWITIATIANTATYLVSVDWDGFRLEPAIWTCIILAVGGLIGGVSILKWQDIPFGLVYVWAYLGIVFKHLSAKGFDGEYTNIIFVALATVIIHIVLMAIVLFRTLKKKKRDRNQLHQQGYAPKNFESTDYYDDIEI